MRLIAKVVVVAVATLAATAVAAPAASATEPVVVSDDDSPCSFNITGRCYVSFGNESWEQTELGAQIPILGYIHQSNCDFGFRTAIDGTGQGYLDSVVITNCSALTAMCGGAVWPFSGEEVAPGVVRLDVEICLTTSVGYCSGTLQIDAAIDSDDPLADTIELRTANRAPIGSSICRVTGHWTQTYALQELYFNHL